jgi:hypothetical protein
MLNAVGALLGYWLLLVLRAVGGIGPAPRSASG